jgi:hypothetical protein
MALGKLRSTRRKDRRAAAYLPVAAKLLVELRPPMLCILLQSRSDVPLHKLVLLLLAIMAVVAVGFIVVQRVKRAYQADDAQSNEIGGFTLSDLRDLHKSGKMTNEEFEKAKTRVIEAAKRAAERDAARAAEKENERR